MRADGFQKRAGENEEKRARMVFIRKKLEEFWRKGKEML